METYNNQLGYAINCFSAHVFSQSKQRGESKIIPFSLQNNIESDPQNKTFGEYMLQYLSIQCR